MIDFLAKHHPTPDANWRAVVLFGRNVASYKFALAKTLLAFAIEHSNDRVPLDDLAGPFARHLCEHLKSTDKQASSSSSRFLDACRAFNRGDIAEERLIETTARLGFVNVIDAFHVVGGGSVPVRFFIDERTSDNSIRLTDDLRRLAISLQGGGLNAEVEARWRLVEAAWSLNLPRAGLAVQADAEAGQLFVERVRRVNLTGVRPSLNGYQRGRCFYCRMECSLDRVDIDHFFPWLLKQRGYLPDVDGIWNLVLACPDCNRGQGGKGPLVPAAHLVARLNERNNWLVDSHHPLRETIIMQTGIDAEARASFLRDRQRIALEALIHEWMPAEVADDDRRL